MPKKAKKTAAVKKSAAKKTPLKTPVKKAPAKKAAAKTPVKKTAAPKTAAKKKTSAPVKAKATGAAPAKKTTAKKAAAKAKAPAATPVKKTKDSDKGKPAGGIKEISQLSKKARALLGSRLKRDKNATPILFSFDDATALLATRKKEDAPEESAPAPVAPVAKPSKKAAELLDKPEKKRVHAAASLADILGFDPSKKKKETELEESSIPAKWKKYYRLLIELRQHVKEELDLHTADTLKHSSRDDSGDLSGYGLHMADSGTDNFDRDFALSLVSNEQDALYEIEEAIQRIKEGNYGICEVTGMKIDAQRLSAVPFTRFSVEGQSEYEKNKRRKIDRSTGTAFAESSELTALASDDGEE